MPKIEPDVLFTTIIAGLIVAYLSRRFFSNPQTE
jgi:hypothetical protein